MSKLRCSVWAAILLGVVPFASAQAEPPAATVTYQPMVSTGLAANQPFEAWFVFDKSSDPNVPGYAVPAGATIRFVFPHEFTPQSDLFQGAVMLYGWPQGPTRQIHDHAGRSKSSRPGHPDE